MENNTVSTISSLTGLPENVVKDSTGIKTKQDDAVFKLTGVANPNPTQPTPKYTVDPLGTYSQSTDLTHRFTDPIESYVGYNVPLNPFTDWEELRATNQGVMEKLGRGFIKMGATAIGAVAENSLGIAAGIGSMVSGGTYADNAVGRSVDEMNEWLSTNLPHYYQAAELDPNRSLLSTMGTANFWTDKFANGLGYSLGSIATIWATGGVGLLGRTAGAAARGIMAAEEIAGVAKTGETLKNIYAASKMIKTGAKLTDDIAKYSTIARGLNAAKMLEVGAMMSLGEASVEAREKSKQLREELISNWEEQNPGQEMSGEVLTGIEQSVAALSNATLVANLAVLMPTNLLMFGKMLTGAKIGEKATYDLVREGDEIVKALPTSKFGKSFARINEITSPVYKNALIEAFQEGAQYMIGDAGIDYYKNKFQTGTEDISSSMSKALSNTFGTADGLESMVLGALIGGGMGGASTTFGADAKLRQAKEKNTQKLIELYNSNAFKTLAADLQLKENGANLITAMDAANLLGNKQVAKELRTNLIANEVMRYEQLDALDLAFERLDDLTMLTDEEFAKALRFDPNKPLTEQLDGKNKTMVVEELKREMKDLSKLGKDIDSIIDLINPKQTGVFSLFQSKETKQQQAALALQNQKLKTLLMSSMIGIKERDKNIDDSIEELRSLAPQSESFVAGFAAFDRDKLLTAVKRNKITVNEQGELVIPNNLVDINITDTETEESKSKKEKQLSTDEYFDMIEKAKIKNSSKLKRRQKEDSEVITALDKAIEASKLYDAVSKAKFDNAVINLFRNINSRENAIAAFDELIKNPKKREVIMAAKEAAKTKAKVEQANKEATSILDTLQTTEDIDNLIDFDKLTPEVAEDVKRKYEELKKIEDQYVRDYSSFSDENLEDLMKGYEEIKSEDPQRALAIRKIVQARAVESPEEREKRTQNKTPEQLAAEEKIRQEIQGQITDTQDVIDGKRVPSFKNNIEIIDSTGTVLRVNGVTYTNLNATPADAITTADVEVKKPAPVQPTIPQETIDAVKKRKEEALTLKSETNPNGYEENSRIEEREGKRDFFTYYSYFYEHPTDENNFENLEANTKEELFDKIDAKYNEELAALQQTPPQTETTTENVVTQISLTNELGQEVIFKREDNEDLIDELAQVILIVQQSEGTIDTVNLNEEKHTEELKTETDVNIKNFQMLKFKYNMPVDQMSNEQLLKAIKDIISNEANVINTIGKYRAQAFRQGKDITDVNNIEEVKSLNTLLQDINKFKSTFTQENFDRNKFNSQVSAQEQKPSTLTDQEEKQYLDEIASINNQINDVTEKIAKTEAKLNDTIAAIEMGIASDSLIAAQEDLNTQLKELQSQLSLLNNNLNNTQNTYESRKSSQTDTNIQDAQRTEGNPEEQGSEGQGEGNVEVSQQEESDVNSLIETLYNSETVEDINLVDSIEVNNVESIIGLMEEEPITSETIEEDPIPVSSGPVQADSVDGLDINVADSEYDYNSENKVIVNEFGETSRNSKFPYDHTKNGISISQDALSNSELTPIGTEITFEVRPDIPFFADQNIPKKDQWMTVPIYLTYVNPDTNNVERIGLLEPYNPTHKKGRIGASREKIFNEFKKGNKVSAILTGKIARPANTVGEDNNPYFQNPLEFEDFVPGVVVGVPVNGMPTWKLGTPGTELTTDIDTSVFSISTSELGQVAFVFKHPNGGVQHLKATTKKITETAYNKVVELIQDDNNEAVAQIVGFNRIDSPGINNEDKTLVFQRTSGNGRNTRTSYIFYHTAADSYIRISSDNLAKLLSGEKYANYSFVEFERGAKNGTDVVAIQKENTEYEKYLPQIVDYFEEAIMSKRFQVDVKELQLDATRGDDNPFVNPFNPEEEYATYLEYLTDDSVVEDIDSQGHTGILSHDLKLNDYANPYFHTQPRFGNLIINGETLEEEKKNVVPEVTKTTVNTSTPTKRTEDTYEEETDNNSVDPEFAVSNTNRYLDEDEAGIVDTVEELEEEKDVNLPEANPTATSLESLLQGQTPEIIQPSTPEKEERLTSALNEVLDKIENEEFTGMVVDPVTKEETQYLINNIEHDRVTSKIYGKFTGDEKTKKNTSEAGTSVHKLAEAVLSNKPISRPENLSRLAFLQLKSQLERIKEHIAKKKQTIVAQEQIVYNSAYRLAGRFDLLVRNESGTYTIYDFKTGSEKGLEQYDEPRKDATGAVVGPSKRQTHGTQLSVYGYFLRGHAMDNNIKMEITRGNVLYIPIDINKENGEVKTVGSFEEKSFTLSNNLKKLLEGTETFEKKETKKSQDPSVKNAGRKKSTTSTKKNDNKGEFKVETKETKTKKSTKSSNIKVKNGKDVISKFENFDIFTERFPKTDADKVGSVIHFLTKQSASGNMFITKKETAIPMIIEAFEETLEIEVTDKEAVEIRELILEKFCK